ncbi:TetR/AcrR family transcriptional regulator [Brevundimonas vancanneytii]|uniref:Probable acrEF/envCD operon repressor n=1 Tax=Brevundimonas vancanneytii TaxID=1325724 RepID=A0A4P1K8Z7_9CAUL|nr:TetR/AcrR family transcriptional regulator [Brevundimonas vancanneytii]VTO16845.1 Probable acrEF/envCD operon repressor [Brevundimonas vancanneytii]VTO17805.1 Probable acrEF/envCD operon repressor [Brevundimonas vancanneytii]
MSQNRRLRSDVLRSKVALLDAAARLFAEQGVHAPIEPLADMAGVSRATLYRHFPDRQTLLFALFDRQVESFFSIGEGLEKGEVLLALIREMANIARATPVLSDAWRAIPRDDPELIVRQNLLREHFREPLADALEAGTVRADLTLDDVLTLVRMVSAGSRYADAQSVDRIFDLALNGMRSRS